MAAIFRARQTELRDYLFGRDDKFGDSAVDNDHVIISLLKQGYSVSSVRKAPSHIDFSFDTINLSHDPAVKPSARKTKNPDFQLTWLTRMMYLTNVPSYTKSSDDTNAFKNNHTELKSKASAAIKHYPFWPSLPNTVEDNTMEGITFWSENHLLMHLGSAYLFYHYLRKEKLAELHANGDNRTDIDESVFAADVDFVSKVGISKITLLLKLYLEAHCFDVTDNNGFAYIFELNSVTYYQYTVYALMNLFDFAPDVEIRQWSKQMLDAIVKYIMIMADPTNGLHSLAVSGRGKDSNQYLKLHGYEANPFARMLTGIRISPDASTRRLPGDMPLADEMFNVTYLTAALITTTYTPPEDYLQYLTQVHDASTPAYRVSPTRGRLKEIIYEITKGSIFAIDNKDKYSYDLMPFYWSAGLLLDDDCFHKSIDYARDHMLLENPDLILHKIFWNLTDRKMPDTNKAIYKHYADLNLQGLIKKGIDSVIKLPRVSGAALTNAAKATISLLEDAILEDCRHLTQGQRYVDIKMKVHKADHVCITSLDDFNVRQCGYQQVPWMINFDGLPIFSRSGCGEWGGQDCVNFNQPKVSQEGNLLMVTHVTTNFEFYEEFGDAKKSENIPIHLFWPASHFRRSGFAMYKLKEQDTSVITLTERDQLFDKKEFWWIVKTPTSYLACLTNQPLSIFDDAKFKKFPFNDGKSRDPDSSLVTESYYLMGSPKKTVSFVFKAGTVEQYPTLEAFVADLKDYVVSNRFTDEKRPDEVRLLRKVKKVKKGDNDEVVVFRHNTEVNTTLKSGIIDDLMDVVLKEVAKSSKDKEEN